MQTKTVQYKLIKKLKDECFDVELIHQYTLLLNIGTRDLQVLIVDSAADRVVFLEDYVLPNITSHHDLLGVLQQIFDGHSLLHAGFWNEIIVSVKNQKFVQVPASLFLPEAAADYLQFNAAFDPELEECLFTENKSAEAITVFAIWKDVKNWLSQLYPAKPITFVHQSAAMIAGVLNHAPSRSDSPLYVYVDRFRLHVLYCDQGKLVYYNQFTVKQFSDYVKYIMLVMNSLNMDQKTSQVVLWGYIGKNSPHYQEFYKYINNVSFGSRPGKLQFGYLYDEVQDHHFFDLYSVYLIR